MPSIYFRGLGRHASAQPATGNGATIVDLAVEIGKAIAGSFEQTWFPFRRSRPLAKLRLFCLPFAGGNALLYRDWHALLPESVEVCPIQLPGRMARLNEAAFDNAHDAAEILSDVLAGYLDKPYAFFGHSMGALLCYEISRAMRRRNMPLPFRLFLSAHRAPDVAATEPAFHNADETIFLSRVRQFGGPALRLADHPELVQLIGPTLRADLKLCQTYIHRPDPSQLPMPMTLFAGRSDTLVRPESVWHWSRQTSAGSSRHLISGGHFFLQSHGGDVTRIVSTQLADFASFHEAVRP